MKKFFSRQNSKQMPQEPQLESSLMTTENITSQHTANSPHNMPLPTCETLMLYDFKQAYCNNKLDALGTGTDEELQQIWNEILFEYSSLFTNQNTDRIFELTKRITLMQADITYIDGAVIVLLSEHDKEIVEGLRNLGYPLIDGYKEKDLDRIISLSKSLIFDMEDMVAEYELLTKVKEGKKQTENDFNQTVSILSKFQGYQINQRKTSVSEYCSIFNIYLKSTENAAGG